MIKTKRTLLLFVFCMFIMQVALAASTDTVVQKIRYSNTPDKLRIVLDVDNLPVYSERLVNNPTRLLVELTKTINKSGVPQITFEDPVAANLQLKVLDGKLQAVVNLKNSAQYKVFTLKNPNRIVIDIFKGPQKIERQIAPGILYTSWSDYSTAGPFKAHIVSIDTKQGYVIKPVLSNDAIAGLETVASMAKRYGAVAAVNAAYFAPNGEIIGLMKLNGEIVSIPELPRTALGIMPDGSLLMDTVAYSGSVELADGTKVNIDGINCERGPDSLILYNSYFDNSTKTNEFGTEYVLKDGKVQGIYANKGNADIADGAVVLSGHGKAVEALAGLKIGDRVTINQTLGPVWDKTLHVIGAGPTLVKNNAIKVTAAAEQFLPDIAVGRAPRTAVGFTGDGKILLVVVDGRQTFSIGMTLNELAQFMQKQGAVNAMNLDGGGSSEMVVKNSIMNSPSDGSERRVGNALIAVER